MNNLPCPLRWSPLTGGVGFTALPPCWCLVRRLQPAGEGTSGHGAPPPEIRLLKEPWKLSQERGSVNTESAESDKCVWWLRCLNDWFSAGRAVLGRVKRCSLAGGLTPLGGFKVQFPPSSFSSFLL